MMQREVAFINTQGSGPSPANNRGNDDGRQWVWGVEKARMIPSMTRTEQAEEDLEEGRLRVAN
jgi:hypothetical protein